MPTIGCGLNKAGAMARGNLMKRICGHCGIMFDVDEDRATSSDEAAGLFSYCPACQFYKELIETGMYKKFINNKINRLEMFGRINSMLSALLDKFRI
jgi:hypothetical protein